MVLFDRYIKKSRLNFYFVFLRSSQLPCNQIMSKAHVDVSVLHFTLGYF